VYIRVTMGQFLKNHYLRIQCDGPMPYVFIVEKIVLVPMGLGVAVAATTAVGTAALPSFVTLSLVRTETNYFKPILLGTNARVKRVLKEFPELLEAYKQEPKHNKATKAKYITEYNRRKMEER